MNILRKYRTFDDLLPQLLSLRKIELRRGTYDNYVSSCRCFSNWLKFSGYATIPLIKLTNEIISEYFVYLATVRDLDKTTCEKRLLTLKVFWRYAAKFGEVEKVPFDMVVFPVKKKDCSAQIIAPDHLQKLLKRIQKKDSQLFLACMIQYYCFLRPGQELRLMKVGDIDLEQGTIKVSMVVAKSERTEIVTMPLHLIEICKEYGLGEVDKQLYVFGKKRKPGSVPITENTLAYRFNKFRDYFGYTKGYKFYSMKHTGASALHMHGNISMRELMDQLRHTKLDATQRYVKKHGGIVNNRIRENFPSPI